MNEKQLIILAAYINVDGMTRQNRDNYILNIQENMIKEYFDINKNIKIYIIPVKNQESKIECVYPLNNEINIFEDIDKKGDN